MDTDPSRPSSRPAFWNERYDANDHLFGTGPSAFVAAEAHRLPPESEVLELGAGEGRTLAWLCAEHGHAGTAVDFSEAALSQADAWARQHGLSLHTVQADVTRWQPDRRWDAVIVTFLQLLPEQRGALYRCMRRAVRPGGWILGEWFRPAHLGDSRYDRIGPSRTDRMVPVEEVRSAFEEDTIVRCDPVDTTLGAGRFLNGRGAVVRVIAQRG